MDRRLAVSGDGAGGRSAAAGGSRPQDGRRTGSLDQASGFALRQARARAGGAGSLAGAARRSARGANRGGTPGGRRGGRLTLAIGPRAAAPRLQPQTIRGGSPHAEGGSGGAGEGGRRRSGVGRVAARGARVRRSLLGRAPA